MARVGRQADGVYEPTERRRGKGFPMMPFVGDPAGDGSPAHREG